MELPSHIMFDHKPNEEMEENSSIYSFNSPSTSPNLLLPGSIWSQITQLPNALIEGQQEQSNTQADLTRENLESITKDLNEEHSNPILLKDEQQQKKNIEDRGRTNRKRSNSKQNFVCVLAWLVRPEESDSSSNALIEHIQSVRRKYDAAHSRWEPHVTLIPPFVIPFKIDRSEGEGIRNNGATCSGKIKSESDSSLRDLIDPFQTLAILCERIEKICSKFRSNYIEFDEISKFSLRRYDTYHLRPSQTDLVGTKGLIDLQNALAVGLPETIEFSRASMSQSSKRRQSLKQIPQHDHQDVIGAAATAAKRTNGNGNHSNNPAEMADNNFKPHLTLGQASNAEKANEINVLVQPLLKSQGSEKEIAGEFSGPLRVKMDKIQLLFKPLNRSGPYDIYKEFQLQHFSTKP